MTITKRLRYEVLRRDGHRCVYCGVTARETPLTIDHVVAIALGGTDDPANLVAACPDCNAGKSSAAVDEEFVARVNEDSQRWQRAMAVAVRLRREEQEDYDVAIDYLDRVWLDWRYHNTDKPVPRPDAWRNRISGFLAAGLPMEEMVALVPVAMTAKTQTRLEFSEWRYFVGCCRNVLAKIETTARSLVDARSEALGHEQGNPDEERAPVLEDL